LITIESLYEFFSNTRQLQTEGKTGFDIDDECRWSYFFIDRDKNKLTHLGRYLEANSYEVVGFLEPTPNDDDQETIYLRVDRVEAHSVESLHQRNSELDELANQFGITGYDGMDVGAADGP
jgi:hypothetical protein